MSRGEQLRGMVGLLGRAVRRIQSDERGRAKRTGAGRLRLQMACTLLTGSLRTERAAAFFCQISEIYLQTLRHGKDTVISGLIDVAAIDLRARNRLETGLVSLFQPVSEWAALWRVSYCCL